MPIAQVIPLRRLPRQRPWFDYDIPSGMNIQPGQIVSIPFLRQQLSGVVWQIVDHSPLKELRRVDRIVIDQPLVTDWQRSLWKILQRQSLGDIASVVQSAVPTLVQKNPLGWGQVSHSRTSRATSLDLPTGNTWWYRQRRTALHWITEWLSRSTAPAVIVAPTLEDIDQLNDAMDRVGGQCAIVDSRLTPASYRQLYMAVLAGHVQHVIGTWQALSLPYLKTPHVLFDQPEHPAHRPQSYPKWDLFQAIQEIDAPLTMVTPAPPLTIFNPTDMVIPTPSTFTRAVASLDQPNQVPWLTTPTVDALNSAQVEKKQVLLITPRQGYAAGVSCQHCGYVVACPVCHRKSSLQGRPPGPMRCAVCGQQSRLPDVCPRCQQTDWRYSGLGPERLIDLLIKHGWSAATSGSTATAIVGTYQSYRQFEPKTFQTVILVQADALLNWPDFSASERAWQYLARLQTALECPIICQTYSGTDDFWQRWRRGDDGAWYQQELAERQRLKLPPTVDQWLVQLPGRTSRATIAKQSEKLRQAYGTKLTLTTLPDIHRGRQVIGRLLITAPRDTLYTLAPWAELFPAPWQVDTHVQTWLP